MYDRRRLLRVALSLLPLTLSSLATWAGAATAGTDDLLARCVASNLRDAHDKARDIYRHPEATLRFWGLAPGDTVLEVEPGKGWWTDILAPYLAETGGHYIAAGADLAAFEHKYQAHPETFGSVRGVGFGAATGPIGPAGSVDLVIVSRETHNWVRNGFIKKAFRDFHAVLKQGGILAIEDHRARNGADPAAGNGYLPEAYVIAQAEAAGFKLAGRSDINANPADTKDYPFGVWTLPPTRRSAPEGSPSNPNFDHTKYDKIGESDRMTLKFVRP